MKVFLSENSMIPVKQSGFGISLEDVNYAFDGGLYADLLENRNFEAKEVRKDGERVLVAAGGAYGWEPYPAGADVALKLKNDRPLFAENPHYMRVVAGMGGVGMVNSCYGGIAAKRGEEYKVRFFLRSYDYKDLAFVGLYSNGEPIAFKKVKIRANGKWTRYDIKLKCKADSDDAKFVFTLKKAGMVHANDFSLMPEDAVLGVFRRDAVELLKEMKPKFLRFAGGHVPGSALNPYAWKDSATKREHRRQTWNPWAVQGANAENGFDLPFAHYGQTLALGYFECFRLAEYLNAQPVPTLMLPDIRPNDPELESLVQDALDLVEFANGDKDTMWGSLRDELGHGAPFALKCIAVEDGPSQETLSAFAARFRAASDIRLVLPAEGGDLLWKRLTLSPAAPFFDGTEAYGKTFLELSALPEDEKNASLFGAWGGALREAACLTSLERHSDMVPFKSFAPLFARIGYAQRTPALIWMSKEGVFGTPSYYVQKLFSLYTGDLIVQASAENGKVIAAASELEGFTFIKLVNLSDESVEADIEGDFEFGELTRIIRMEGDPAACNDEAHPDAVCARDIAPAAPRAATLPPHSFSVLVFRK